MKSRRIKAVSPCRVVLEDVTLDDSAPAPGELLIRSLCSLTNTGTELARFSGLQAELTPSFKYPLAMGWANLGTVERVGAEVDGFSEGDRVLSTGPHASVFSLDQGRMLGQAPTDMDAQTACFARMAAVSISALRKANLAAGDRVLVIGQGIVGNLAAQLFGIAGAEVMVADAMDSRLHVAAECGITHTVNPTTADLSEAVSVWTDGRGPQIVVEAVGDAELICLAIKLVSARGQVVLLGTPRKQKVLPVTETFARVHSCDITVSGAFLYDVPRVDTDFSRHSLPGNVRQIFRWLKDGRLKTKPLQTHVSSPEQCQQAYDRLHQRRDECQAVLFDWSEMT